MQRKLAILAAIFLAATVAPASARPRPQIAVTADAVAAVRRSAEYLQGLSSVALDARMVIDTFDGDGRPVHDIDKLRYEYRGPDGLRLDWSSKGEKRRIYSNGYIVTYFLPASATYVTVPQMASGDRTGLAAEDLDIVVPLPDFFVWAVSDDPSGAVPVVRYLGRRGIDGKATDHYAVRRGDIELEIWIDRGPRPLPRRILITAPDYPGSPRFAASLRWTIEPRLAASRFTFAPPAGARRIEVGEAETRDSAGTALLFETSFRSTCGRTALPPNACHGSSTHWHR